MAEISVVLLGARAVGKTSLAVQLAEERFVDDYNPTESEGEPYYVPMEVTSTLLSVIDTPNQDDVVSKRESGIRTSKAFCLIYSITDAKSFSHVARTYVHLRQTRGDFACIVVANKGDLEARRAVPFDEGQSFAKEIDCPFFEITAQDHEAVKSVFRSLVRSLVNGQDGSHDAGPTFSRAFSDSFLSGSIIDPNPASAPALDATHPDSLGNVQDTKESEHEEVRTLTNGHTDSQRTVAEPDSVRDSDYVPQDPFEDSHDGPQSPPGVPSSEPLVHLRRAGVMPRHDPAAASISNLPDRGAALDSPGVGPKGDAAADMNRKDTSIRNRRSEADEIRDHHETGSAWTAVGPVLDNSNAKLDDAENRVAQEREEVEQKSKKAKSGLKVYDPPPPTTRNGDVLEVTDCERFPPGFLANLEDATLQQVKLPQSLKYIGSDFLKGANCPKLSVSFRGGIKTIGDDCLRDATFLSVSLSGVIDIGRNFASGASFKSVTFPGSSPAFEKPPAIGDNFFAFSTGVSKIDARHTYFTTMGENFAANSQITEVSFSSRVQNIGKNLCLGCPPSVHVWMMPAALSNHLACLVSIMSETERFEALTHFTRMWGNSGDRADIARWLLTKCHFTSFKAVFDFSTISALRFLGGSIDDLPVLPAGTWLWCDLELRPHDSRLSLIHWAVKHSRHCPELLKETPWTLNDLTLRSTQGLTALHYAVLFDVELWALQRLLDIAAKAEVHRTWRDAHDAGGVPLSPLHLAYLFRRDRIVKALLAFEWEPTETILEVNEVVCGETLSLVQPDTTNSATWKWLRFIRDVVRHQAEGFWRSLCDSLGWPTELEGFDAYDQAIVALGRARSHVASMEEAHASTMSRNVGRTGGAHERRSAPERFMEAVIILGVSHTFSKEKASFTEGCERAYRKLKKDWVKWCGDVAVVGRGQLADVRAKQEVIAKLCQDETTYEELCVGIDSNFDAQCRFFASALSAALSDSDHSSDAALLFREVVCDTMSLQNFLMTTGECSEHMSTPAIQKCLRNTSHKMFAALQGSIAQASETLHTAPLTLLKRVQSMEEGPHKDAVENKLENVIPFRVVFPQLPFFYLMILLIFGLSWFFHPPILAPVLMGIENTIHECTNPYNTDDATKDGVLPWNCSGFTEVGVQNAAFIDSSTSAMRSSFKFINKSNLPRNVTHMPWTYLRFVTTLEYDGVAYDVDSLDEEVDSPSLEASYWVFTELRKFSEWPKEHQQQKNPKAGKVLFFKAETTRSFSHIVMPKDYGWGVLTWLYTCAVLTILCFVAACFHGYLFVTRLRNRSSRLIEMTVLQRSVRGILLACDFATVVFVGTGVTQFLMQVLSRGHEITRSDAIEWQRIEMMLRFGAAVGSFRAVAFLTELPKRHHFVFVNSIVVAASLTVMYAAMTALSALRVGVLVLDSLFSLRTVDAIALPLALGVSILLRSSKVSEDARQAHYEQLVEDLDLTAPLSSDCQNSSTGAANIAEVESEVVPDRTENRKACTDANGRAGKDPKHTTARKSVTSDSAPDSAGGNVVTPDEVVPDGPADGKACAGANGRAGKDPKHTTARKSVTSDSAPDAQSAGGNVANSEPEEVPNDNTTARKSDTCAIAVPTRDAAQAAERVLSASDEKRVKEFIATILRGTKGPLDPTVDPTAATEPTPGCQDGPVCVPGSVLSQRLNRARWRFLFKCFAVTAAGVGQLLLCVVAAAIVLRPLLALTAPTGAHPTTAAGGIASETLGSMNFVRRIFL